MSKAVLRSTMKKHNEKAQKHYSVKALAISGWLTYTVGSLVCTVGYEPGLVQLTCIYAACLTVFLYAVSCVLATVYHIKKWVTARNLNYNE